MTRLNKLLHDLCPDGVEYKSLEEIFDTRNGYTPSKSNSEYWKKGTIPWFRMEDIRANGRILTQAMQYVSDKAIKDKPFPANSIIVATSATVGEHALLTVESLANQRFTYLILKDQYKSQFDINFLYYYCFKLDEYCLQHLKLGNFSSVDMSKFAKFLFPVPPLEVQQEIVRILDQFTQLTAELTERLNAELTARKRQYEYYQQKLLNLFATGLDWYRLGDVCNMKAGKFISAMEISEKQTESTPIPCYGGNGIRGYVSKGNHNGEYPLIGRQGALCGNVNYAAGDFYATEHAVVVKTKGRFDQRYLFYLLTAMNLNQFKSQGAQPGLSVKRLEELMVPVPPLPEQRRIVAILDRFDTLCNDLTSGLPAEIAARQKQYEYYRDKLLTFPERKEADA